MQDKLCQHARKLVNMEDNYVYMQDNYVDMQVTNLFREFDFYIGKVT